MKFKLLLPVILFLCVNSRQLYSQDWNGTTYQYYQPYNGYVVLQNGDTLRGYILHGDRISNQKNCVFYPDITKKSNTKIYKPKDLKSYSVADKVYVTIHFSGGLLSKPESFVLLTKSGRISRFTYYSREQSILGAIRRNDETEAQFDARVSKDEIVWVKEGQEPLQYAALVLGFAKKVSKLVDDYPELSAKVANKEKGYGITSMNDIVDEYNIYWLAKNSINSK